MKVLLINGSPKKNGCTFTALSEVGGELTKAGVETEIWHMGTQPIRGCTACARCIKEKLGHCVFDDDKVNECVEKMKAADGIIVGSPVYYAGPNGMLCAMLDRVFYSASRELRHKPAAGVVSCRRAGSSAALDRLNKYFSLNCMPMVTSQYWAMVHGATPEDVVQDLEGMQVMRTLGREMAWLLECIDKAGVQPPEQETPRAWTNFIR